MTTPVIIEAAINGVTSPRRNPHVPTTPEDLAAVGLACLDAGASVIHTHASDLFAPPEQRAAEDPGQSRVRERVAEKSLLGRAAQPQEVSQFLAIRSNRGQGAALETLLNSQEFAEVFGQNTVPYIRGLATANGQPLTTVNRTAALYAGNAGLNPSPKGAI
jgi:phycobilisome core-membrane linker protein